ncbi:MAG: glutamate synthase [Candidatus Latescibacteria bacterium]|nr:glutamate synthase [Candidatus Latescibacterota bacterium]NIO28372.1 glutamate synthase [Candidatus Latescibacterota bacterium]NIO55921.1 glutamate synthase [Candidatus Latescibacterota bacterium]NIT01885.1 glutamate synthase [Candidatus Latescibacterota bacterium]
MAHPSARVWECGVCGYLYDEKKEGTGWDELPEDWECPICGALKSEFIPAEQSAGAQAPGPGAPEGSPSEYLGQWARATDDTETLMADIHRMAATGESIIEPMRSKTPVVSWNDILIKGAQLARFPLNKTEPVNTRTVVGHNAKRPLVIETPIYITHMSFGALSREIKLALAKGSAAARTAMCSGEGGILKESLESAHKYIFEYVPNRYSVTDDYLRAIDAIEIKIGQSAKPGMGGHLPANKVTKEIAEIRGFPEGTDITSPSRFDDIANKDDLKKKVQWLREKSSGKPIGIKIAGGHIEADLEVALHAGPDFITIDGKPGATGAAPKFIKSATSVPTIFALHRARKFLDEKGAGNVSLLITGGLRVSPDFAKALALGADAIAIGTSALMACGCQQYRICHTGKCPVGITTQDPGLRARLDINESARRLENFLRVSTEELKDFARLTGNKDVHDLSITDLCTINSEISEHTDIEHV